MFGTQAQKLAGLAGALLGWRPQEFWAATPAELEAVLDALMPQDPVPDAALLMQLKERFPDG